jgi:NAD(P)-dependent dehydrogenase (short-subunit alcohol dehydrogenase family)
MRLDAHRGSGSKTALVTGASGGLGSLVTAALVRDGWRVFATVRDPTRRERLDAALAAVGADASRLTLVAADLESSSSIGRAVSAALAEVNHALDAVVPCAGVLVSGPFEEAPPDATRRVMEINYFGVVETVRATLPALRNARGRIVLISSDSGFCGTPGLASYTASKFALEGWAESLSDELAPFGVHISLIQSGPFKSGIYDAARSHRGTADSPYARLSDISDRALQALQADAPPAEPVVAAVIRALSVQRPRLRYIVGREAWLLSVTRRLVPDNLFRRIARRLTGMHEWSESSSASE